MVEVLARNRRDHVKIVWNGWYLRGAITKEGVQTSVRSLGSTRCVFLLGVSPRGSANPRLSDGGEDGCWRTVVVLKSYSIHCPRVNPTSSPLSTATTSTAAPVIPVADTQTSPIASRPKRTIRPSERDGRSSPLGHAKHCHHPTKLATRKRTRKRWHAAMQRSRIGRRLPEQGPDPSANGGLRGPTSEGSQGHQ